MWLLINPPSDGWTWGLVSLLGPTILVGMFGLLRWIASYWNSRVEIERKGRLEAEADFEEEAKARRQLSEEVAQVRVQKMFLEDKVERLESEIERLHMGRSGYRRNREPRDEEQQDDEPNGETA